MLTLTSLHKTPEYMYISLYHHIYIHISRDRERERERGECLRWLTGLLDDDDDDGGLTHLCITNDPG